MYYRFVNYGEFQNNKIMNTMLGLFIIYDRTARAEIIKRVTN